MNIYIQRRPDENWAVWQGETSDFPGDDQVAWFKPPELYYLDAYSYGKTLAEELGVSLIEVPKI